MKVLVTGGAGYLGSILVPMLLQNSYEVTVLDNFMFGQTPLLDHIINPNLTIVRGDARNHELILELSKSADVVIPLACLVGAPICDRDPYSAREVNLESIKKLCSTLSSEQMMIFPCTNSGYGVGEEGIYCDENSPLGPISLYGRLKVEAEEIVREKFKGVTFRFATLFGMSPKMRLDLLVNDFVYRAVKDRSLVIFEGDFKRNYLHVRDAARAFLFAMDHYKSFQGESFNVGLSDSNLSKRELCLAIQKEIPTFFFSESEFNKDPDQRNYIVSNQKIEDAGFLPEYSLKDGIRELIQGAGIIDAGRFKNI